MRSLERSSTVCARICRNLWRKKSDFLEPEKNQKVRRGDYPSYVAGFDT